MKRAFTLIELLVVIGVMAVIAAGVIATINPLEKRRQAQDAQSQSYVGQVGGALQAFAAADPDGLYPANIGLLVPDELTTMPILPAGAAESDSGMGTVGPVCVGVTMQAAKNTAIGPCWTWCSDTGSALGACP